MYSNWREGLRTIGVLVLALCVVAPSPGQADAQASTKSITSVWDKYVPSEIKSLAGEAKTLGAAYSDVTKAVDVGIAFLTAVGVLESTEINLEEEFQKIHDHLDRLYDQAEDNAGAEDWKDRTNRQSDRIAKLLSAVQTAEQAVLSSTPLPLHSPAMEGSKEAVNAATQWTEFRRRYTEGDRDEPRWSWITEDAASKELNYRYGYEWRLGVPELMQLIALRIQVIAAFLPEFRTKKIFKSELDGYREGLQKHYTKMLHDGVKCGSSYNAIFGGASWEDPPTDYLFYVGCVDIYTGASFMESFYATEFVAEITFPLDYARIDPEIDQRKDRLFRRLLETMPFFEMRSLIDTLYLYANPIIAVPGVDPSIPVATGGERDPAETKVGDLGRSKIQRIAVAEAPDLCLDVQWGNPAAGTPVWLWPCVGNDAQQWVYDRPSGTIRNPVYDKCLDVQWGNPARSTPVWIWDCIGSDAQKWTYDPETGVLQNALGTVLDIQWGELQASTPVWTWDRHEGPAQRWLVEG